MDGSVFLASFGCRRGAAFILVGGLGFTHDVRQICFWEY